MIRDVDAHSRFPITRIVVPVDAPDMYRTNRGNAPITRGAFSIRLSDGTSAATA